MPFNKWDNEVSLGRVREALDNITAPVPDEIVTALERWSRLKRAAKPARPDPTQVHARIGGLMARAVSVCQPTLHRPRVVDAESLVSPGVLDDAIAELARGELLVAAFPAAINHAYVTARRVITLNEEAFITALQARYGELADTLWQAAHTLPGGFTEQAAAYARNDLLAAWQSAASAHEEIGQIRSIIIDVLDQPGEQDEFGVRFLRWTKSDVVRANTPFQERLPTFGDPADLSGHLALARLVDGPDQLWCPTASQATARARQLWPEEFRPYVGVVM
jgi:hypothetical protein